MKRLRGLTFLTLIVVLLSACSTKKNTPASRQWQAFTTRYNVYYNGKEHFIEQLQQMENAYEDDYTRTLLTHPAEARADQKMPQPSGDFKRTIEKMQKSIQLHSIKKKPPKKTASAKEKAFRAREEFNPFLHNAWLTMGRAQYYDGDFSGAAATFMYISKHFTWLPEVVTEARIWQTLCYCAMDWIYEAENSIHLVKENQLVNKNLRRLYDRAMANLLIRSEKYDAAVPYLTAAAKSASGTQKNRLWFLLGQVYSHLGKKKQAYEAFRHAGEGQGIPYRAKFNARIKQSEVYSGRNITKEVNSLKAMTRYARNKEFEDQIYYAIGNLYLSRGDSVKAIENYKLSVEKSTRNGIDKALSQLALGNIYFAKGDYVKAQPCYAEAIPQLPESYPDYKLLKRRSDVLDELAVYAQNVQLQDSLLTLSEMTPEQQMEVAKRLIAELVEREKKAAEEAKREEAMAERESLEDNTGIKRNDQAAQGFTANGDKSWYFYTSMTKSQGKTEFQRRWGARRLEDDWRRRNKSSFAFGDDNNAEQDTGGATEDSSSGAEKKDGEGESGDKADPTDPHNPEYYLSQIPNTEEQKKNANDIIQEGLYNMGLILKDKLEDYPAAKTEFLTLEKRYPDNVYRLDVYYNLYLMAVRKDDTAEAEYWRGKILSDFPDSPYGQAMRDPKYFDNLRRMNQIQEELYEEAYQAYLDNDNSTVHRLTAQMETDYPLSKILPKFVFINALSYLTEKDNDQFRQQLTSLLDRWPDTEMTPMAAGIMKGLNAGRVPNAGMSNSRGLIWSMSLSNDSTGGSHEGVAQFMDTPDSVQYIVLAFPRDSVNSNQLLFEVARFNFSSFVVRDFDMEPMSFGEIGLIVIKGFKNLKEAEYYSGVMQTKGPKLPEGARSIIISKHNFELLLNEGRSFDEYFRFVQSLSDTPPDGLPPVTPPEDKPTAQEDDAPEKSVVEQPSEPVGEEPSEPANEEPVVKENEAQP